MVREPEDQKAPTRKGLGKGLVKTLRTVLSQCRGRGFESPHLHQVGFTPFSGGPDERAEGGNSEEARDPKMG
jgi:hypothetical protein